MSDYLIEAIGWMIFLAAFVIGLPALMVALMDYYSKTVAEENERRAVEAQARRPYDWQDHTPI